MRRKHAGVGSAQVARIHERSNRTKCVAFSDRFIVSTVNKLQKLNCEFDIAQTAGAKFDLRVKLVGGNVSHDPLTHALGRFNEAVSLRTRPNQWL